MGPLLSWNETLLFHSDYLQPRHPKDRHPWCHQRVIYTQKNVGSDMLTFGAEFQYLRPNCCGCGCDPANSADGLR